MTRGAAILLLALLAAHGLAAADEDAAVSGLVGLLLSREANDLDAPFEGKLLEVRVRLGDTVRRGEILATLDDGQARQELEQARGDLEVAAAGVRQAEAEVAAAREAVDNLARVPEAYSADEIRQADQRLRMAELALDEAEARERVQESRVRQLADKLEFTKVAAPFDGTVAGRFREPGMTVGPGIPIVRIVGEGGLWVRFAVPIERSAALRLGAAVEVSVPALDLALAGTIRHIASEVDAASGMILCEAAVAAPEDWSGAPLAGQPARVAIRG